MIQWLATLQALLLGGFLLWAGLFKLLGRSARVASRRSALARLVGDERAFPVYRVLGGVELAVAALLLLPPARQGETIAVAGLTLSFVAYVTYARIIAPGQSCGCLSSRRIPVTWRAFARAGSLLLLSMVSFAATGFWADAVTAGPVAASTVLLGEFVVIVAFSADLDWAWLQPLRRLRVRLRHPLAGVPFDVPLESTVQQLRRSEKFRSVGALLRSDVQDTWDEGDWRIICYAADYEGYAATAVFAVPRLRYQPDEIRLAVVDESGGSTLIPGDAAGAPFDRGSLELGSVP